LKKIIYILILLVFISCDYLGLDSTNKLKDNPIASVYDNNLYAKDISDFFPKNISEQDSIILAQGFINSWATKQLLLFKAEENLKRIENNQINMLVLDYRDGLLINGYKEKLIKQQLDTVVSDYEIENYYKENSTNFKLNEELLKVKYIHYGNDLVDKREVDKLFISNNIEDLELLEKKQLSFKSLLLNDSVWTTLESVALKMPFSKDQLLKKSKLLQKEDSLGLYLVTVKNFLKRNDTAPLSYVKTTVRQMILHKRKLELIREIEKILIKDAIQNKNLQIY